MEWVVTGALQVQVPKYVLQRNPGIANSGIGRPVINLELVLFKKQSAAKDNIAKEALTLIAALRFKNRPL